MRVITGTARGMKLKAPEGMKIRPTTDQVKESIFSIIQFEVEGSRVLDLFAGTGQLGIEALSRGARSVTFVDNDKNSIDILRENLTHTRLDKNAIVRFEDGPAFVNFTKDAFDIVFLDPPYQNGLIEKVLPVLACKMSENGVIVCETSSDERLPESAGAYSIYREYKYGKVKLTVYRPTREENN